MTDENVKQMTPEMEEELQQLALQLAPLKIIELLDSIDSRLQSLDDKLSTLSKGIVVYVKHRF